MAVRPRNRSAARRSWRDTGAFDDLDAAFNYHPSNVNAPSKGTCVGVNDLVFRFHGRTAHAGGAPHEGRSALDAVELMNVGANYLREHVTDKVRIHYVITDGGTLPNVVPDTAEVWYFVRALERAEIEEVSERVRNCARGAALMTDTTVEMRVRGACSRLLNNAYLADLQYEAMQLVGPIEFTAEEKAYAAQVNAAFPARNADEMFAGWQAPPEEQSAPGARDARAADRRQLPGVGRRLGRHRLDRRGRRQLDHAAQHAAYRLLGHARSRPQLGHRSHRRYVNRSQGNDALRESDGGRGAGPVCRSGTPAHGARGAGGGSQRQTLRVSNPG